MSLDLFELKNRVEAALMAAGEPVSLERLRELFANDLKPNKTDLVLVIQMLSDEYRQKALEIADLATGYTIRVRKEYAKTIAGLWSEKPVKYSKALFETLALVAYRQPITRAEIEKVRGVAVGGQIIKTLLERDWIKIVGYRDLPGKPALYATTKQFLDDFSLKNLEQLPPLEHLVPVDE